MNSQKKKPLQQVKHIKKYKKNNPVGKEQKICPDCGNAQVNHTAEKFNAGLLEIERPFARVVDALLRYVMPYITFFLPTLFKYLSTARLGKIHTEPDATTSGRSRCIWLEAKRRGINMWEFRPLGKPSELFVSEITGSHGSHPRSIVFEGLPRPGKHLPASLAWVDDKTVLRKKFSDAGINVARGGSAFTWKKTLEIFRRLQVAGKQTPVIIKPSTGSRSRHTTIHITDEVGLRSAFTKAKQLSPRVIIEEELTGQVYRGTVIGHHVIGIRRKDPPHVVGDGIHTIHELIATENTVPARQGPIYRTIPTDGLAKKELARIPALDEIVMLNTKSSIGLGGGSTDVTDIAHRDIVDILLKIANVLNDELVGVDMILSDISRPLSEQAGPWGIIEANSLPFINVHLFPLHGKARDTAGALWDVILK